MPNFCTGEGHRVYEVNEVQWTIILQTIGHCLSYDIIHNGVGLWRVLGQLELRPPHPHPTPTAIRNSVKISVKKSQFHLTTRSVYPFRQHFAFIMPTPLYQKFQNSDQNSDVNASRKRMVFFFNNMKKCGIRQ